MDGFSSHPTGVPATTVGMSHAPGVLLRGVAAGPRGHRRDSIRRRMLAGADAVAVVVAASLVATLSDEWSPTVAMLSAPVWVLMAKVYGLYDRDHRALRHLTIDELKSLVAWSAERDGGRRAPAVGRRHAGSDRVGHSHFWLVLTALVAALRATVRAIWRRCTPRERALLVGSGPLKAATARKLELFPDIHVDCVASSTPATSHATGTQAL